MPEPVVTPPCAPGWYGKIPSLGDFASRRLPDDFIHAWDGWLQHGMACARAELGAQWMAVYLVAPVRRFWIAAGLLGEAGWAGLFLPSVDRVGRHFPFTIATPMVQPSGGLATALAAHNWFAATDAVARQVLDVDFTIDDLERRLAQLAPLDACVGDAAAAQALAESLPLPGDDASVWWCGDAHESSQFVCADGMPPAQSFAALLVQQA